MDETKPQPGTTIEIVARDLKILAKNWDEILTPLLRPSLQKAIEMLKDQSALEPHMNAEIARLQKERDEALEARNRAQILAGRNETLHQRYVEKLLLEKTVYLERISVLEKALEKEIKRKEWFLYRKIVGNECEKQGFGVMSYVIHKDRNLRGELFEAIERVQYIGNKLSDSVIATGRTPDEAIDAAMEASQ